MTVLPWPIIGLEPVSGHVRMIAEIAASMPDYVRTEQSDDLLYQALDLGGQSTGDIYQSLSRWFHRVVPHPNGRQRRERSDASTYSVKLAFQLYRRFLRGTRPTASSDLFVSLATADPPVRRCHRR